jgi:hypothetical protein
VIRQRKDRDGLQVQVYAGRDPLTGRKRWVSRQVPGKGRAAMKQARQVEAELLAQIAAGQHRGSKTKTVAEPLAGVAPIPASSGQVTRHRLNRGGDRQLNRALHTVALVRLRDDPITRAYAARRRGDGKSPREIRRCVKRAIARHLFKLLQRYDRPDVEIVRIC